MRSNMELCDVTLRVGNVTFSVHRLVLAGNSPYFRNIFLSKKATDTDKQEVILPSNFRDDTVRSILDYFYSGNLTISQEDCEDLLSLASLLQIQYIIDELQEFIISNLHASNCLRFQSLAHKLKQTDFKAKIDRFVDWNFKSLLKEPDFLAMSAEHLIEVIRSENLRVKREETVYEAVYRWFRQDISGRENKAESVFKEVRFEHIPPKYLTKEVIPNLCDKYNICVERVREALDQQAASGENVRASKSDFARKPRDVIYVISCRTNLVERFDTVQCACIRCHEISPTGPVESLSENRCAVVVGQDLYCVSNTKVDKFSVLELCWTEVGEGADVHDSGVCAGKDCIFVVGGRQRGQGACRFDLETNEWVDLPDMNTARRCPGVAFLSGKLYVIGGHSPEGALASTERFDTKQEKWVTLKPMNMPRFLLGACAVDGLVYVVGGRNNERSLDTVEVYDPKAKVWTLINENMRESRNDFGLVSQSNEIYCIGGRSVSSIECFDLEMKEWKTVGSTGENNFSISCVFYPPL
ncbi:hypothetical protein ACROYT_G012526 [Oculina patagonica]